MSRVLGSLSLTCAILFRLRLNRCACSLRSQATKSTEKGGGYAGFHRVFLYKIFNHLVMCGNPANFYVSYDTDKL